jgi:hypothetical protein
MGNRPDDPIPSASAQTDMLMVRDDPHHRFLISLRTVDRFPDQPE